jgi:hypothetical protein
MSLESYLYEEKIDKLVGLLERVLFAWSMGRPLSEENDLYMKATDYLKGLKDE